MASAPAMPSPLEPPAQELAKQESGQSLASLIQRAQMADSSAVEALLEQFRPLLRSRMRRVWAALQDDLPGAEWADVEAQVHLLFLTRLQEFRADEGVYFPYYIAKLLDLDCRTWLRRQRQSAAVPFSQLCTTDDGDGVEAELSSEDTADLTAEVERAISLRQALHALTGTQQQVVWQCCVLGRTENEVAAQLGLSRSAVRNRLAGALARLRAAFEDGNEALDALGLATRTGRDRKQMRGRHGPFWQSRMIMAKDEKRPDLVGIGAGRTVLLQGIYDFEATGLKTPQLLSPKLTYTVPAGCVLGIRFFRVGVMCPAMVCISSVVNGLPHRLVPVAANSALHVPLAIVEPIIAGSQLEIHIASTEPGTAIVDIGCLQMPA